MFQEMLCCLVGEITISVSYGCYVEENLSIEEEEMQKI
jgi:hypothetical protein